jgi:ATP adenylyltransferase
VTLQQLWAGWRYEYVESATASERAAELEGSDSSADPLVAGGDAAGEAGCVFCRLAASGAPSPDNGVVVRDDLTFTVLNLYPYASGHLLVLPVRHLSELDELTDDESSTLWNATRTAVRALHAAYVPDGVNVGANLGRAAGAGIPRHLHLHVVPRWSGDTNFMTAVGGVRVLPQSFEDSWRALTTRWPSEAVRA